MSATILDHSKIAFDLMSLLELLDNPENAAKIPHQCQSLIMRLTEMQNTIEGLPMIESSIEELQAACAEAQTNVDALKIQLSEYQGKFQEIVNN